MFVCTSLFIELDFNKNIVIGHLYWVLCSLL